MEIEKIELCFNKIKEALKIFYEKYIKPLLSKLKELLKINIDAQPRINYKPIKRIIPKINKIVCKPTVFHCRNNC